MATQILFQPLTPAVSHGNRAGCPKVLRSLALLIGLFLCSTTAQAQLQQAFVFAADPANPKSVAVYTRNDLTGALAPVPGSPFPSKEAVNVMALDFKGRFLFTANDNPSIISMFTVDPNTGALQEVQASPFASSFTNRPVFLSTESSGQFLYVINFNSSQSEASSVESFQIQSDTVTPDLSSLSPSRSGATQLPGLFLSGATHPSGKSFYAFLNFPNGSIPNEAVFLLFDSSTGTFTTPNLPANPSSVGSFGCCLALDPQGAHLAIGFSNSLLLYSLQSDGTLAPNPSGGSGVFSGDVNSMSFDTLGQFLYADLNIVTGTPDRVHFFLVATLQESADSPLLSGFPVPGLWNLDPTAPLIYADQVYQVDPQTGIPASILLVSPIAPAGSGIPHAIFSRPPGSQPIVGPIALLSATSLSFGSLSIGQTSSAQTLTITSNGGQALSLNTLAITGANPGDFAITSDGCHAPTSLPPSQSCSVLISFTPSAAGSRTAALTITDNASPAMESAQLNGTGLTPAPAVTLVPGSLDFGATTLGASTPMNVTVTNSGTAALHITSVAIGGANSNDFAVSDPACTSALSASASCTITVTFTPLALGLRTASVTLTDDASDSPQILSVKGNANAVPSSAVLVNPGSPDFGTTTQGTSTPLNVTVKNTGTAALHIASVVLGAANGNEFSFSDPACNAAIPVSGTCTIVLTYTPISVGAHVATVTLADDAPDSPQILNVKGNAAAAITPGPAPNGSTTASVSAGQSATYLLQLTPGAGYSGTVSLACAGAPLGATCQVPASVAIATGTPAPFTVSVSTSGGAMLPPSIPIRFVPPARIRVLLLLALALVLFMATKHACSRESAPRARHVAWSSAFTAIFVCSMIYAAGCGSGSASSSLTTTPPPIVTPPGTSTITIAMSALSPTQQPLQLQPIQLTLTVK